MSDEKETKEAEPEGGETLMGALDDFNAQMEGPPEEQQEPAEKEPDTEPESPEESEPSDEPASEPQPEVKTSEEPPTVEEEARWLIEGKFKDNDEGKENLAKSYKEMQSLRDKDRASFEQERDNFKPLQELDTYLKETPEAVEAIQQVVAKEKDSLQSPEQPDDFDVLDVFTPGTPSSEWFNKTLDFREERGARRALDAIANTENKKSAEQELQDEGLSAEDIESYKQFMQDPTKATTKNLVRTWRLLTDRESAESKEGSAEPPQNEPGKVPQVERVVSAAAISGSVPQPKPAADKNMEEFWGGIMEHSK
jgi:hypothetical protein